MDKQDRIGATGATETTGLLADEADVFPHIPTCDETERLALSWRKETWLVLERTSVVSLAYILQNSLQTSSILVFGQLSTEALEVASFSYMFAMCTAWLIGLGGTTAMDTLASSAFTANPDPHRLGLLLLQAFIILTLYFVRIALLWLRSESLFRLLGQEEYICLKVPDFSLRSFLERWATYGLRLLRNIFKHKVRGNPDEIASIVKTDYASAPKPCAILIRSQRSCAPEHMFCW